ncbi:MAG: phosphoribosyltransferase [Paraclostridium sp.]
MINFISNIGIKGVIPTYKEIHDDVDKLVSSIYKFENLENEYIFFSIPRGGNIIADRIKYSLGNKVVYADKSNYLEVLNNILENNKVIIVDDIFCHGETILDIINNMEIHNIKNIVGFFILYHIPSREIALINDGIFHLEMISQITNIYYIKYKCKLNIPIICYKSYDLIVMPEDINLIEDSVRFFDKDNNLIDLNDVKNKLSTKNFYGDCK